MPSNPKTTIKPCCAGCGREMVPMAIHRGWTCPVCMSERKSDTTNPGRDVATELRLWLTTYTGSIVHRHDAQNLMDFLKKSGWKEPANAES